MIFIAADHAGYPLKEELKPFLEEMGLEVVDLGNEELDPSDDYPDFAYRLAQNILDSEDSKGILICGTGQGVCIAANKVNGIRAALVHDEFTALSAAEHLDANVICFGGRVTDLETAKKLVKIWLEAEFSGDERHERRIEKIENIERS
ncbi:MAG: ribose-5-phosphate isomerase [Candidatus Portnoybacteria bacterium]|nr:ribose-5-phosphate isomerase [Candidatus Portnoybacteria bacterium]